MRRKDESKKPIIADFINAFYYEHDKVPSVREIEKGTGIPLATVHRCLISMKEDGDGRSRKGKILFIFDEPTTGLHFYDVEKLLKAFDALLAGGHSIVVVEHNLDVIRCADWVIDLGPEAGDAGGKVVFEGTPEEMIARGKTHTAEYLRRALNVSI